MMKNKKGIATLVWILIILVAVGIGAYFLLTGDSSSIVNGGSLSSELIQSVVINPDLAKFVALEKLDVIYSSIESNFDINNLDDLALINLYDIDGQLIAYEFIFKTKDFEPKNLEELNLIIYEERNMNNTNEEIRGRYHSDSIYTIIVGAKNTLDILERFYRALPEHLVRKPNLIEKLDSEYSNKNLKLGRVIAVSPLDIFYEVLEKEKTISEGQIVSDDSYLLEDSGKSDLVKVSEYRDLINNAKEREEENFAKMGEDMRKMLQEGEVARVKENVEKWQEFEDEFNK